MLVSTSEEGVTEKTPGLPTSENDAEVFAICSSQLLPLTHLFHQTWGVNL